MMIKRGWAVSFINALVKGLAGIGVEILATFAVMGIVFGIGFLILKWFSK